MNHFYVQRKVDFITILDDFHLWENATANDNCNKSADQAAEIQDDAFELVKLNNRVLFTFKSGDQELFRYDGCTNQFLQIESDKQNEHDCPITAVDYNRQLGLLVSSDQGGFIKLWSLDKKFIREIQFPHQVDAICFFNTKGDLLVSHEQRVSLLQYSVYENKFFDIVMA